MQLWLVDICIFGFTSFGCADILRVSCTVHEFGKLRVDRRFEKLFTSKMRLTYDMYNLKLYLVKINHTMVILT